MVEFGRHAALRSLCSFFGREGSSPSESTAEDILFDFFRVCSILVVAQIFCLRSSEEEQLTFNQRVGISKFPGGTNIIFLIWNSG